jgi:hypothetical protein
MIIEIHVITNAKKQEMRLEGQYVKIKLVSVPRDGKANGELIDFLAAFFRVRKSGIKIVKGEKERKKLVSLPLDEEEFRRAISNEGGP